MVDALNEHLKPLSGQAERRQLLRQYLEAGTDRLALLMRIEHRPVRVWHRTWVHGFLSQRGAICALGSEDASLCARVRGFRACTQADRPAYHQLMPNHTLRLALAQKTVIEFPVILVLLQQQLPQYTVVKPGQT